jgi:hypothetical protein
MSFVSFALYNTSGVPLTGQTPSFVAYKDATGANRTPPTLNELGGGLYGFTATNADEQIGTSFLVDCGLTSSTRYFAGSVGKPIGYAVYDSTGAPLATATPTIVTYKDASGVNRTAPSVVNLGAGLYALTPTDADVIAATSFEINNGASAYPARSYGIVEIESTGTLSLISTVGSAGSVTLNLSDLITLTSDSAVRSKWSIVDNLGNPLAVNSLSSVGSAVTLGTAAQVTGRTYTVTIPYGILKITDGSNYVGPYSTTFGGTGVAPTIVMSRSVDSRTIEVIFSESVVAGDALNPTNYAIPGLTISTVTQITPVIYRITTSRQSEGTTYTVTASNIHDVAGNNI